MLTILPDPPEPAQSVNPAAVAAELAKMITENGLKRESSANFLVIAGVVAALACIGVLLLIKLRKDAREDRRQQQEADAVRQREEREFRLKELALKIEVESQRSKQTSEMTTGSAKLADAAACHERAAVATNRNLELSDKHLTGLLSLGEQRKCKAGD